MENNNHELRNRFILYPLRGFVIAFVPWLSHIFSYRWFKSLGEDQIGFPIVVFYIFSLFVLFLIYNSFTLYFATYDREEMDAFLADGAETLSFFGERKRALCSLPFCLEVCSALLFSAAFLFLGGFGDIDYLVFRIPVSTGLARLIGFSGLSLFLFVLILDRRCEARKYWEQLHERGDLKRLESKGRMAVRGIVIAVIYPVATPLFPMLLYFIINLGAIVFGLASMLSIVGFILSICAFILFIWGVRTLRFLRKRKKIEKRIAQAANAFGYKLRLFMRDEIALHNCNGYLEKNEKRYYFKIMRSPSRFTPLYFQKNDAYYLHKYGTKNHYRSFERHVPYTFDANGQKSIILPKITNYIYVKEDGSVRRILEGDDFWHYSLYNPSAFIGNLERECIGRNNKD